MKLKLLEEEEDGNGVDEEGKEEDEEDGIDVPLLETRDSLLEIGELLEDELTSAFVEQPASRANSRQ